MGCAGRDRREDFRTEVLGLVKAQMVKNAVIVPTGSKGGFFAKQLPDPTVDREAWLAEGIASYKLFISGAARHHRQPASAGEVVPPPRVVRHDDDDTYLVVAADKGTATFSDIANGVAQSTTASGSTTRSPPAARPATTTRRWASPPAAPGSRSSGTSARWASTPRPQDFTVVGVGDMSGDVFGNGMLLSEHIRLVAAFDHRHVFVDPDPVAATSLRRSAGGCSTCRARRGPTTTRSLISAGGGVFAALAQVGRRSRPQMAEALGLPKGATSMTPGRADEGDPARRRSTCSGTAASAPTSRPSTESQRRRRRPGQRRDPRRRQRRCAARSSARAATSGLTQLGRIEAALHGVRVNTDAIDNSAGVDTSDHEVNIKILLDRRGRAPAT